MINWEIILLNILKYFSNLDIYFIWKIFSIIFDLNNYFDNEDKGHLITSNIKCQTSYNYNLLKTNKTCLFIQWQFISTTYIYK